jgi:hypothetical protein
LAGADDIEPARPLLAPLYRSLADVLDNSSLGTKFRFLLKLPVGTYAERPPHAVEI